MGRIIINNESSVNDGIAVSLVLDSIKSGRISNNGKQYCYAIKYEENGQSLLVVSSLNKNSDSFKVVDYKEQS